MIPIKYGQMLERYCYTVPPSGRVRFEKQEASQQIFLNPALGHIVIPYEYKPVLDTWTTDTLRTQKKVKLTLFMLRLVRWERLWLVLSVNTDAVYSFAVVAHDWGYRLSDEEFTKEFGKGRQELFPFTSPTFRTLRPALLQVERHEGHPE